LTDEEARELGSLMAERNGRAGEVGRETPHETEATPGPGEVHDTRLSGMRASAWERDKRS
jgi:hypothetical protein